MIRVRLHSGQRRARRLVRWLAVTAAVAVAVVGALRLIDGYYPLARAWNRVAGAAAPARAAGVQAPPAPLDATPAAAGPAESELGVPNLYSSAACSRALALPRQLPADVHVTSLTGRADGEFALEGLVPAAGVVELLGALDGLPSQARLSYWRGGHLRAEPHYKFIFDGRLPTDPRARLSAIDGPRVLALADEVSRRAQHCGLQGLRLEAPVDVALGQGRLHRRYKCRATGAVAQISAFLGELGGLGQSLAVGELRVLPAQGGQAPGTAPAKFYATLDFVVVRPHP